MMLTRPTARTTLAVSLALALALPLAPREAEARSVLGRVWDLVTAPMAKTRAKVEAPTEGTGTKSVGDKAVHTQGASAKDEATDAVSADGQAAKGAKAEGTGAHGTAGKGKDADGVMDDAKDFETTGYWPQKLEAQHGQTVEFAHSHMKGRLGDRLTALRLLARGYKKLPSKYDGLHGFDGVYIKKNAAGEIVEIRLVESKVDKARLNQGPPVQMSEEWIRKVCAKMQKEGDTEVAETARLILDHLDSPKLKRELWHHDLAKGKTAVRTVDDNGKPREAIEGWADKLVANEIERQCAVALLVCN
jgi:hypothetical protein